MDDIAGDGILFVGEPIDFAANQKFVLDLMMRALHCANKLKLPRRQQYGRNHLDLLHLRLVYAACDGRVIQRWGNGWCNVG